jgi:hypothetical protein
MQVNQVSWQWWEGGLEQQAPYALSICFGSSTVIKIATVTVIEIMHKSFTLHQCVKALYMDYFILSHTALCLMSFVSPFHM